MERPDTPPEADSDTSAPAAEVDDTAEPEKDPHWVNAPTDEIGDEIVQRIKEYYETVVSTGMTELWGSAHTAFYGLDRAGHHESSKIVEFGNDGEKLGVRSNQLRSMARYIHSTVTADRPVTKPRAKDMTAASLRQIPTARRVLDYYRYTKRKERYLKACVLRALIYGKAYFMQIWDPTVGKLVQRPPPEAPPTDPNAPPAPPPEPQKPTPEGDIVYSAHGPMEVAHDFDAKAHEHDWLAVRKSTNRYDAAATYTKPPDTDTDADAFRQKILNIESDLLTGDVAAQITFGFRRKNGGQSDIIYEYHFMHRKTPSCPDGRYVILLGEGLVVFDGPLPFPFLPVDEMVPEEFLEAGSVGYSSIWDLLGLQQAYDSLLSTCMTNFDAFGHNDILLPDGVELSVEEVRDGLNVIRFPAGEHNRPSMLEKFSVREEVFKLREWVRDDMHTAVGVNDTALGNPQASLKSGTALALVQAQAVHFQSGLMAAYSMLIEDSDTKTLGLVREFCDTPRIAAIAGTKDKEGLMSFTGKDINAIERVEVEQVNPIFATVAGRFDIANNLLERNLIKDVSGYYQVLETGRLEAVEEPGMRENTYMVSVKEALMAGPEVQAGPPDVATGQPTQRVVGLPVMNTDDPRLNLWAVKDVMASAEARADVKVATACTAFAMESMRVWRATPPDMLNLLGYPLPPPPPGMDPNAAQQVHGAGQGAQGAPPKAAGGVPPAPKASNDQQAPDQGAGMPSLPKPPSGADSTETDHTNQNRG